MKSLFLKWLGTLCMPHASHSQVRGSQNRASCGSRAFIRTDVKDERTLDVRVTAALSSCRIEHQNEVLHSLAEVIATAPGSSVAKGITKMFEDMKLDNNNQQTPVLYQSRLE